MNTYPKLIALLVAIAAIAPLEAKPKRRPCAACQVRKPAAKIVAAAKVTKAPIARAGNVVGTIGGEVRQIAVIVPGDVKPGDVIGTIGGKTIKVIACESLGDGTTRITEYIVIDENHILK